MIIDYIEIVRWCHQCQFYGVVQYQPPNILHLLIVLWSFECWDTGIAGPVNPPSSKGRRFIFAVTDYFSKWIEEILSREVKAHHILSIFKNYIVYRFGVSRQIIFDNGTTFRSPKINNFTRRYSIDWQYSIIYYPRENGLVEAFNKTLVYILKKILNDNKR